MSRIDDCAREIDEALKRHSCALVIREVRENGQIVEQRISIKELPRPPVVEEEESA